MKKPFFHCIALALILCPHLLLAVPLTGTKTVGGASPDYATFAAAVADLNLNGVGGGGVTFVLRSGTYPGGVVITATGTAADPIIFQSENLDASSVTISNGGSTDVVALQGASYLTMRALTIDYTATSGYNAVEIADNSDYVTITNCILDGSNVSATVFASSAVYANENSNATDCDSFVVQNCTIRNGSYGIYFGMSTSQPDGIRVENNIFENSYAGGMYLQNLLAPTVSGNSVTTTQTGNSSFYGIYLNNCDGKNIITGNYIYTSGTGEIGYGINLISSASGMGNNALLANNSIQISNTNSIAVGIEQSNNSTYYDIYSNTVYVSGGTSSTTFAYRTYTSGDDTKIKNNIFVNFAAGTGISSNQTVYIPNASGVTEASHNCYWTENTGNPFRANYNGNHTSLATYTAALGETNAVNINPQMTFVNGVGWKATNPLLTGAGLYLANVPADIDGVTRLNPTTIGAHENVTSAPVNDNVCDATVINFNTPISYSNTGATAEVSEPVPPISDCTIGWCPGDGVVQNSVWFTFTMNETKLIRITTTGFDNQITLYSAASCSTSFTFATASDISGGPGEIDSYCISAGRCYIQVDGFQGASGSGTITLTELTTDIPVAVAASNTSCNSFTANWNAAAGATRYFVDVATDSAFTQILPGYNDHNTGSMTSVNVTGLAEGTTYYYRVRADNNCVTSANSNAISVQTLSSPVANFTFVANNFDVTFTNTSLNAVSYQWDFGDGNSSTAANPTHTYAVQGTYQVRLIATNTCRSDTVTQTVNMSCNQLNVTITAGSATTFCDGDSVVLATVHTIGNSYQWLESGQPISGAQSFNYSALESGDYSLSVTDFNSCPGVSNVISVTVNATPVATIQAQGAATFCDGDDVELMTTAAGLMYQWLNNGQPISNAMSASYTADASGNYSLQVTDGNNCSAVSNAIVVTEHANPVVTIQANSATTFCTGDNVELETSSIGTYQWKRDGQNISGANNSNYVATTSGSYSLSVIDGNACAATSNSIAVVVNDLPALTLAEFDTMCTTAPALTLSGGTPAGGSYSVDGTAATSIDPSSGAGVYEIEYEFTDGNNCTASATQNLVVSICSGVEDVLGADIFMYPNPVSEVLTVKVPGLIKRDGEIFIYDATGKEVIRLALSNRDSEVVNVQKLEEGIYFVRIVAEGEVLVGRKVSVMR